MPEIEAAYLGGLPRTAFKRAFLVRKEDDEFHVLALGIDKPEIETTTPVRVVKLTDAEAIEVQCVENLQREDIHPLEEALGFKSLLELGEPVYTIATIASRAGKSEAYVYGRIRLADLIPPVAEAFLKDRITIGHALLIAKLPASQQQEMNFSRASIMGRSIESDSFA